ncbi:MAG: bifunctional 2-polyprenyl-6-hydroxyphenol methylase/3-demethylubiquinol 3-O-methyltransferase UbiG [Alteromonadaceae bacterium]|nr:bifunctional 2-polyprenyl-6-hydroxyphenol methylase/3-demethylubiquinol 3-O-methyltransferase UbiG [Alteromonadaceae bacterium]
MNVDHNEIEKFSAIAERWWDHDGEFKPLHQINPLRVSYIIEQAGGIKAKNILDIGCGGGILSEALAKGGATVTGIDLAEESLQIAKLHGLESGVKVVYEWISAEDKAEQQPQQYDVVTCLEMLEHVPDPTSVVRAAAQCVKPGGKVFFSTLNRNPKSYLMAILGAEYILNLVPKGTHDYKKFIKPSELMRMIDDTELVIEDTTGLHYNPLSNDYFLSNRNIDVNYIVSCSMPG